MMRCLRNIDVGNAGASSAAPFWRWLCVRKCHKEAVRHHRKLRLLKGQLISSKADLLDSCRIE